MLGVAPGVVRMVEYVRVVCVRMLCVAMLVLLTTIKVYGNASDNVNNNLFRIMLLFKFTQRNNEYF
jgi:hypothetical protein